MPKTSTNCCPMNKWQIGILRTDEMGTEGTMNWWQKELFQDVYIKNEPFYYFQKPSAMVKYASSTSLALCLLQKPKM